MYFNAARLRLFLSALLALQFATWYGSLPLLRTRYIDYRSFYAAGTMVRTGQAASLYDYEIERRVQNTVVGPNENALPYMPAPFTALFFVPLSLLPFRASYFVFLGLNLAFAALAVRLLRPYLTALTSRWRPLPEMLFLTFLPLGIALMFGQLSILLLLLYCAAFVLLQSQRPFLAGLVLALTLIKFQVAIPVLLLFAVWRCWRLVAGAVAGGAALLLISLGLIGKQALMAYPQSLVHMTANASTKAMQIRFGIVPAEMPNFLGFFHCLSAGHVWGEVLVVIFSLTCLVWAALQKPSLPLALLAGVLVSYHLFLYDLTMLLLPVCLVANRLFAVPATGSAPTIEQSASSKWMAHTAAIGCAFLLCSPVMRLLVAANVMFLACIPVAMLFLSIGKIGTMRLVRNQQ